MQVSIVSLVDVLAGPKFMIVKVYFLLSGAKNTSLSIIQDQTLSWWKP